MEYKTIDSVSLRTLDARINAQLADGWQLYRGIVIYRGGYIQAMTRTVKQKKAPVKRFQKPTKAELLAHKADKGLNFDVNAFLDFCESCGWTVGRKPMKSWTHAVSNWIRNKNHFSPISKADSRVNTNQPKQFDLTQLDNSANKPNKAELDALLATIKR